MLNIITKIKEYFLRITLNFLPEQLRNKYNNEEEEIIKSIRKAQEEIESKEKYFNHATDPDLVDYAIYDIETSRKKYNYLLKKLKKGNNV